MGIVEDVPPRIEVLGDRGDSSSTTRLRISKNFPFDSIFNLLSLRKSRDSHSRIVTCQSSNLLHSWQLAWWSKLLPRRPKWNFRGWIN